MKANRLFTMFLAVALFCSCLAIPASATSSALDACAESTTITLVPVAIIDSNGNFTSLTSRRVGTVTRAPFIRPGDMVLFGDNSGNKIPVNAGQKATVSIGIAPSGSLQLGYTLNMAHLGTWFYYGNITKAQHTASTTIASAGNYYFSLMNTNSFALDVTNYTVTLS